MKIYCNSRKLLLIATTILNMHALTYGSSLVPAARNISRQVAPTLMNTIGSSMGSSLTATGNNSAGTTQNSFANYNLGINSKTNTSPTSINSDYSIKSGQNNTTSQTNQNTIAPLNGMYTANSLPVKDSQPDYATIANDASKMPTQQFAHKYDQKRLFSTSAREDISSATKNAPDVNDIFYKSSQGRIDATLYPNFAKFFEKFYAPNNLIIGLNAINDPSSEVKATRGNGSSFVEIGPNMINKIHGIDRIINAERMKKLFKLNNFDCLKVPDKYLVYAPSYQDKIEVITKKIGFEKPVKSWRNEITEHGPRTLKEVQQLFEFTLATGYTDWKFGDNIVRDANNKFIFLDTEDRSFTDREGNELTMKKIIGDFIYHTLYFEPSEFDAAEREEFALSQYLEGESTYKRKYGKDIEKEKLRILQLNRDSFDEWAARAKQKPINFDEETTKWLKKRYKELKASPAWNEILIPLHKNSQYDSDIDFEKVKHEYSSWILQKSSEKLINRF